MEAAEEGNGEVQVNREKIAVTAVSTSGLALSDRASHPCGELYHPQKHCHHC